MTDATTIKLSQETKEALDKENRENESFDETVARVLGVSDFEARVREITRDEIRQYGGH